MQNYETILIALTFLGWTIYCLGYQNNRRIFKFYTVVSIIFLSMHLFLEGWRWQMSLIYLLLPLSLILYHRQSPQSKLLKFMGVSAGTLVTVITVLVCYFVPVFKLPIPAGTYAIGTFSYTSVDEARKEEYAEQGNRKLYTQVWYPAQINNENYTQRTMWEEIYKGELDWISLFSSHLRLVDTHAFVNAPIVKDQQFPVVIFNHGLYLPAEQNTVLAEHLVSHGFIVISIAHPYETLKVHVDTNTSVIATGQLAKSIAFSKEQVDIGETAFYEIENQHLIATLFALHDQWDLELNEQNQRNLIASVLTGEFTAAKFSHFDVEVITNILRFLSARNNSIQRWVDDIDFIVNNLSNTLFPVAGFSSMMNLDQMSVMGMSRGGAAASEYCRTRTRCKASINLDGFQYGKHWREPITVPFLVMYSTDNVKMNHFSYKNASNMKTHLVKDSSHADFSDLTLIFPLIHYGDTGKMPDAKQIYSEVNNTILNFLKANN